MQNTFEKKNVLKETLKRFTPFSSLNLVPIYGQDYEKQKGSRTSYQSLFQLQKHV